MTRFSFENGYEAEPNNRTPKRLRTIENEDGDDHDYELNEPSEHHQHERGEDDDERNRRICDDDEEERIEEEQIGESSSSSAGTVLRSSNKRKRSISFTLDDSDVFDCPVCCESLKIPVFQCENGHIACSSCCTKLHNKCPFCCFPIGYNRCRAVEKIIETVKVACQNSQYGCKEKIRYGKKDEHEDRCLYSPSLCPLPNCTFFSSIKQISKHLNFKHSSIQILKFRYSCLFSMLLPKKDKFTFFLEENEASLFVLKNTIEERFGNALTVNCIGPVLSKTGLSYDIIAKTEGCTLRFQSVTEHCSARVSLPSTGLLLIPTDFTCSGSFKLDICIHTNSTSQTGS